MTDRQKQIEEILLDVFHSARDIDTSGFHVIGREDITEITKYIKRKAKAIADSEKENKLPYNVNCPECGKDISYAWRYSLQPLDEDEVKETIDKAIRKSADEESYCPQCKNLTVEIAGEYIRKAICNKFGKEKEKEYPQNNIDPDWAC